MERISENSNNSGMQQMNFNNLVTANNTDTKRQVVFDRLKKRMNLYRKRQNESIPRFDQTFNGICEQQSVETNVLQKRFIESKAKRVAKKTDKKQEASVAQVKTQNSKRLLDMENEDLPPVKMPSTTTSSATVDNIKFQVEIVHEFTTSVASLQSQQINTNVTVKATTNGCKYETQDIKLMKIETPTEIQHDFKQEPDNEFADLDFGGLANFMANENENELKKLFSNISEVFDQDLFDQDKIKQEPNISSNNHAPNQQQFNHYTECQLPKATLFQEMSPAAQTLKNMAQQHQVKNSIGINYMRPNISLSQPIMQPQQNNQLRMTPYQHQQQFNDFSGQFQKTQMPFSSDLIKQEIINQQQSLHHLKPINQINHQMQQNYQNAQFNHQRNNFNSNQNSNMINVAMKQQFNGTTSGGNVHMHGGQHISGRIGEFTLQQQQQMYFNQYNNHQSSEGNSNFSVMQNQSMSFTHQ